MPSIEQYVTLSARRMLREKIIDAGGNEVFFVGSPGEDGRIDAVRVVCRGKPRSVMVLYSVPAYGDVVLHNHPSGQLLPSHADEEVAHRFDGKGVGFFIIDNEANDIYPLIEPFAQDGRPTPLDEDEQARLLGPEGPLASSLQGYETRPEQIDMLRQVVQALNNDQILLVEAGTGTGKSLAYLLPTVAWARLNRERVLISTNTINLQEQLFFHDVPLLQRVLGDPFTAALVKGRQNYLCLRRLRQTQAEPSLLAPEEQKELQSLGQWVEHTASGDRADLPFMPKDAIWSSVNAEADTCLRIRCEHYRSCFYYAARRSQAKADLLITNHHIFFADISLRRVTQNYTAAALLPPYGRVILDEAHNLEDAASSYLGFQITRLGLLRTLGVLLKKNRRHEESGLLIGLAHTLLDQRNKVRQWEELRRRILEETIPRARSRRDHLMNLLDELHNLLALGDENSLEKIRITDSFMREGPWEAVQRRGQRLAEGLRLLAADLSRLGSELEDKTNRAEKEFSGLMVELAGVIGRIGTAGHNLELFFRPTPEDKEEDRDDLVRWFELKQSDSGYLKMFLAPLEIGAEMEETVYDKFATVILTSATLTTGPDDFSYLAGRLGIDRVPESRVVQEVYPSPFDYACQSLVGIPTDIPSPKNPHFNAAIEELIYRALEISDGRAFVLCTSFSLLRLLYERLSPQLEEQLQIRSLRQGAAQRHVLLQQKKKDRRSVLFATDSFWEGVDVRGDALAHVVLTRLPFRVPSEPLIEARVEAIEERGENSFIRYTVPAATIKFKQGFGRLIRSREDRGTVLILDKRVIEKGYGKKFLRALPEDCPRVVGPVEEVLQALAQFHANGAAPPQSKEKGPPR